jgi:hypothetical protein
MNAAGAASMTWESGNGALIALRGTDGTWGTPVAWEVANHAGIDTAIDNTGNVIVAFGQYTGLGNPVPVYGALHPAGGSWGSAVLLSSLSDLGAHGDHRRRQPERRLPAQDDPRPCRDVHDERRGEGIGELTVRIVAEPRFAALEGSTGD